MLADLFEAFVGAYCLERGWAALLLWLEPFFRPLVELATEDFLQSHRDTCWAPLHVSNWWRQRDGGSISQTNYQKLLQFFDRQRHLLASTSSVAVDAIPLSTKFIFSADGELVNDCDRVEIAHHLISQWICNAYVSIFPENRRATARAAHLATVRSSPSIHTLCIHISLDHHEPHHKRCLVGLHCFALFAVVLL